MARKLIATIRINLAGGDASPVELGKMLGPKGVALMDVKKQFDAATAQRVVDPTGCGDAYRAGLLFGLEQGLPLEGAARIGSLMGCLAVEERGTQSVCASRDEIRARYEKAFGERFPVS